MNNEHIHVEFHNRAKEIFFSLLKNFESSSKNMDRRRDENQFQELKNKYINTLKQELETHARSLIEQHQHDKKLNDLNNNLQYFIKDYLHLFLQKTRFA